MAILVCVQSDAPSRPLRRRCARHLPPGQRVIPVSEIGKNDQACEMQKGSILLGFLPFTPQCNID
jgi:hypothetical protein